MSDLLQRLSVELRPQIISDAINTIRCLQNPGTFLVDVDTSIQVALVSEQCLDDVSQVLCAALKRKDSLLDDDYSFRSYLGPRNTFSVETNQAGAQCQCPLHYTGQSLLDLGGSGFRRRLEKLFSIMGNGFFEFPILSFMNNNDPKHFPFVIKSAFLHVASRTINDHKSHTYFQHLDNLMGYFSELENPFRDAPGRLSAIKRVFALERAVKQVLALEGGLPGIYDVQKKQSAARLLRSGRNVGSSSATRHNAGVRHAPPEPIPKLRGVRLAGAWV